MLAQILPRALPLHHIQQHILSQILLEIDFPIGRNLIYLGNMQAFPMKMAREIKKKFIFPGILVIYTYTRILSLQ